jgi:hypothetical protein
MKWCGGRQVIETRSVPNRMLPSRHCIRNGGRLRRDKACWKHGPSIVNFLKTVRIGKGTLSSIGHITCTMLRGVIL